MFSLCPCGVLTGSYPDTMTITWTSIFGIVFLFIILENAKAIKEKGVSGIKPFVHMWSKKTTPKILMPETQKPTEVKDIRRVGYQKYPHSNVEMRKPSRRPAVHHKYSNGITRTTVVTGENDTPRTSLSFSNFVLPKSILGQKQKSSFQMENNFHKAQIPQNELKLHKEQNNVKKLRPIQSIVEIRNINRNENMENNFQNEQIPKNEEKNNAKRLRPSQSIVEIRKINKNQNMPSKKKILPILKTSMQHQSKPKIRMTKTKQREVQRIIKNYEDKLEKLKAFKQDIISIIEVKKVTKAPKLSKRQNQRINVNPDLKEIKKKKASKSDALRILFDIAGEEWMLDDDKTESKPNERFSCPRADGYFPSATSCSVYYRCVHGQETRLECSPGLSWSINKGGCDWKGDVRC